MKKAYFLILSLILLISGCTINQPVETTSHAELLGKTAFDAGFDTYLSVQLLSDSQEQFDEQYQIIVDKFTYMNNLFDIYNDYVGLNNIKTINDNAGIEPVEVDPLIIEMLAYAKEMYEISNHEFDVTLGPVLKIWHTYREQGIMNMENGELGLVPTKEELEEANACVGWNHLQIDEEHNTVYLDDACASLDVGGIAKGFATEQIAQYIEQQGYTTATIDAGGNSRTIGNKMDGTPWKVGIVNPDGVSGSICRISIDGSMSFVTSGDYQRYYIADDGNIYHHIIDPNTLYPATYFHSVTVITQDSGAADALSTSLFSSSYEDGLKIIDAYKQNHPDAYLEVIWIMDINAKVNAKNNATSGAYFIAYTDGLVDNITMVEQ